MVEGTIGPPVEEDAGGLVDIENMSTLEVPPLVEEDLFDKPAFAALFHDVKANRKEIFIGIAEIIRRVAQGHVRVRSLHDLDEIKGDALTFAMGLVDQGKYDPARRTAYDYFYSCVLHQMQGMAVKVQRRKLLGDADFQVCFDDMREVSPRDVARLARSHCANNWRSYRIHDSASREVAARFFDLRIRKAKALAAGEGEEEVSDQERAVAAAIVASLQEARRALLGE